MFRPSRNFSSQLVASIIPGRTTTGLQSRSFLASSHTMAATTPVLLMGATTQIGRSVAQLLQPEYNVIHFMQSTSQAEQDIPTILLGKGQESGYSADEVGTKDFSSPPKAVVLGGAFSAEDIEKLRTSIKHQLGRDPGLSWLMRAADGEARLGPPGPGYAEKAVAAVKKTLNEMQEKGQVGTDAVFEW